MILTPNTRSRLLQKYRPRRGQKGFFALTQLIGFGSGSSDVDIGDNIARCLRFNSADSTALSRTQGASGSTTKGTYSLWFKPTSPATSRNLYDTGGTTDNDRLSIVLENDDTLAIYGQSSTWRRTSQVFRDMGAYYHVVIAIDTTQGTADNRIRVYVNGVEVTAFGTKNNPSGSATFGHSYSGTIYIGRQKGGSQVFNGLLAMPAFVDGQQLDPTSFGRFSSDTGEWVPKNLTGITWGTNGYYLDFSDNSNTTAATLGADRSGNGNNWTPANFSVSAGVGNDSLTDTPTNNYCVLSAVDKYSSYNLSNGGLTGGASGTGAPAVGTIGVRTGKWYWEVTVGAANQYAWCGVVNDLASRGTYPGGDANGWAYYGGNGQKYTNGSNSVYGSSVSSGDIIGVAFDADNGKLFFAKNNTWQNSGDPVAGTNAAFTGLTTGPYMAAMGHDTGTSDINFGQRAFTYTPPTGYLALCSANLTTPTILKGNAYVDAKTRTGTGASASVTGLGFAPDLAVIKSRSNGTNHNWFDTTRGTTKGFVNHTTAAQYTDANTLTAFNSDGITLGSDASARGVNTSTHTYIDWFFKKGATPGFDIVQYTGDNTSNRNISHSLGAAVAFAIIKRVDSTGSTYVYHKSFTGATYFMQMDSNAAQSNSNSPWGTGNWSSTQFMVTNNATNNLNASGATYIAYLWAEVPGFSAFGSYKGNGASDGPVIHAGHCPRLWIAKKIDGGGNDYRVHDTARDTYNVGPKRLWMGAGGPFAEDNSGAIDMLSGGWKIRIGTEATINDSGFTFMYCSWATTPAKYARAR